ncbi:MAG: threonine--tRNA ligase [Chlorobium limicola]|uniref:Threonine--tRNA ligase n=1 Tax=Chlorobium limicola (strain DSM 245 / NBRC 103803 / 6330) TaxID=290315 RepID=SYT_CHLL2|nr:threonine--tRNA ligase [Chlorobium limicola]B3EEC1.1 RecName: Full=Threonine--tRNA ligase; AltName: Full=Threonyl-tRNA synthetase; Short=ThrRS [Chlorobium limicola DSM 245]ACD89255.1 threonyl-tRNA synthetase [Chlorobium limicola DSM 245]NTV07342.1 threonine--tRNA ligase [Chlorobium limicola]
MSDIQEQQASIAITLPDGTVKNVPSGSTGFDIALSIGKRLADDALAVTINGKPTDLHAPVLCDANIEIVTFDSQLGRDIFWHTASHIMAQAIEEIFPGSRFGAGPATEQGFYYDVASEHRFREEDLRAIEQKMLEIAKRNIMLQREEMKRVDAIAYFTSVRNDPYKVEILEDTLKHVDTVSLYHQGDFADLCTGPHLPSTSRLKAVLLSNISSSYWRGDSSRENMQRIYGIAFPSDKLLKEHIARQEEAKRRDHRKLGTELELFMLSPEIGSGLPVWLPKGAVIRSELETFLKEEQRKRGYLPVYTPHIGNIELYKRSGHYPYYSDSQFPPLTYHDEDGKQEQYLLKPMNCPHHHLIYSSKLRSYRDLPIRLTEFGTVYRHEQSGELNGLVRARGFTQDDSHIYCTPEQLVDEICNAIDLTQFVFGTLGFSEVQTRLSMHDPANQQKYGGTAEIWEQAEKDVREAADRMGIDYFIGVGEASFYGPKIDFIVRDALGRKWQLGTVQVDYVMPERFDLSYIGSDGQKHRPVVIHRAPFGSMERFIGVLIEHTAGNFPLWLAPVQAVVLPIAEEVHDYAKTIHTALLAAGIRVEIDTRNEKIGRKIREAEIGKIPCMIIVGQKERDSGEISLRRHRSGDMGSFTVPGLIDILKKEISERT